VNDIRQLEFLLEPKLQFGFDQVVAHPKDGLILFGPYKKVTGSLRIGLVSTPEGALRYSKWVHQISHPIHAKNPDDPNHTVFPGFEAAFGVGWPSIPSAVIQLDTEELRKAIHIDDRHQAIYKSVGLYADAIERYLQSEADTSIDLWFVVVPEFIYTLGRPKSIVAKSERLQANLLMNKKTANRLLKTQSLFENDNRAAEIYLYDLNFHHQLKARLLKQKAPIQVVRETTLTPTEFEKANGMPMRALQDPASLAWNLTTTSFFKACGQPWRLAAPRPGVCYVGLVFKRDVFASVEGNACCGAQMFLESGDGVVFRGAVGPWYSIDKKSFHLNREKAKELMTLIVDAYKNSHEGLAPKELFIHGKTNFSQEEWEGFSETVPPETRVACIRIREASNLKLFRLSATNVPRGLMWIASKRKVFLWTKGFIPRLQTYPGREVPNPLSINIVQGHADIRVVAADVLALTKLNYNACIYGDGVPVTLRFADAIGEILTAGPIPSDLPPLPFRYYI
jgi:hypothetical protein